MMVMRHYRSPFAMATGTPEGAVEVMPSLQVTVGVRALFDVVLPMGALLERGHRGDGLGWVAIEGQHVLFDARCHFPEDVPV
jgi:hypothetical protein